MIFVMMADDAFSPWVDLALEALAISNPNQRVLIYDLSDQPSLRLAEAANQHAGAEVIYWPPGRWLSPVWVNTACFEFFWPHWPLKEELKRIGRLIRWKCFGKKKDGWILDKNEALHRRRHFVRIICQKPEIIWHALESCCEDITFVDADAIVLDRLNTMPVPDVCCAFTVVSREDLRVGIDTGCDYSEETPFSAINAGVMFFRRDLPREFIDEWWREIERVHHSLTEQTALACLLWRVDPELFQLASQAAGTTQWSLGLASGRRIAFSLLPCSIYNHYRLSTSPDVQENVKVIHFVGGWKHSKNWEAVNRLCAMLFERQKEFHK